MSAFGISHRSNNSDGNNNNSNGTHHSSHSDEANPTVPGGLPIALSLTGNQATGSNGNSNSAGAGANANAHSHAANQLLNVGDNARSNEQQQQQQQQQQAQQQHDQNSDPQLKTIRHYVYSANQPDADRLLHLNLPENTVLPPPRDARELRRLKDKNGLFSIRLTPYIDNVSTTNQGLYFDPIIRTAGPGSQLVIGRYTERVREAISKLPESYHPVVFKSKVISRTHGCFKVDSNGNWFVKDVKSSSGTFLNRQRLSPASTMSRDIPLHDGDILQLGMDFRGGTEEIYRCVKMRIELNKSWKRKANAFNKEALQKIRNLQKLTNGGLEEEDCSICLSKIKPCQAIFISPCSHSWHFHCVRRLVMSAYPQFVCPNCRSTCDLEATIESSDSDEFMDESDADLEDPDGAGAEGEGSSSTDHSGTATTNNEHASNHNSHNQPPALAGNANSQEPLDPRTMESLGVQLGDPKEDIEMRD